MGAEEMWGPPQRTPTPPPMGEPGGGADRPSMQSADPPNIAAHGGGEALAADQPDTEPEGPTPDTECEDGLHRPSATDRAGAAPLANLALRADASTPGGGRPRDPPETRAGSETREATPNAPQRAADGEASTSGHNRDDDSFDAFMESCRGDPHMVPAPAAPRVHPEPQRDQAEDAPLTASRQAHLQRDYTALGQVTAAGERHATVSGTAGRTTDERGAPGEGARVEAATNTVIEPISPPPGTGLPWGRRHLDYARLEGDANRPSEQAEQAGTRDLGLWVPRLTVGEQLALAVRIRWLLTSRSCHLAEGTRTMADVTFGHRTGHTPPATMDHPGQWHYVATRLMVHMGAYSPDEMDGLHWQWHQRAALRIRATMQNHDIWGIPGSPGYQEHASGHQRLRSQDVPEPPRQAARRNSPERPRGPPPGMGSPSGTYRCPLRPVAPRRGPSSPHASGMQGGTPEQRQETRNPGRSRRRSRTPPPAARRVVFHEGMGRDHGGPCDPHAQRTLSTTDPRRRSKRPRSERTHIPTILTPVERERQAALHADPRRAADGASSLSATSLPGSAANPLSGDHTPRTRDQGSLRRTQGLRKERGGSPPLQPPNHQATEGTSQQPGHDASGPRADAEMTGTSGPRESAGPLPAATPCSMSQQQEPSTEYVAGGHPGTTSRHPSPTSAALDQDRVAMPPPPPRPPQQRGTGPFDDAELRALYGIDASTPSSELVATLCEHLRDVDPNRVFAVFPLPHAGSSRRSSPPGPRSPTTLLKRGSGGSTPTKQAQGGVWIPHLGWVHTLIAPPTDPRPAPSTGGRERAAPPPRPETLRIPPYEGLATWESGTARSRGHNLTSLTARYPETARAAPPPRERDPGTIAMILLENGHYYQVRIIPHPQESHWSLEAVDSMLPATTDLQDSPTPLLPGEPPDPLTAIVSGTAGTWHPGHALYCLWRWAQRRWPHTRVWSATWRFYIDGRQHFEAIPERTAETPTAPNLCPVFAIHQIRALALGEQLQPAIHTETEAKAPHAALVHEIFSAVRSALVRRVGSPKGPEPQPATEPAGMTRSRTRETRVPHLPCARKETTRRPRVPLLPPEDPAKDVTPTAAESARNHDNPGQADLAQKDLLVQPNNARLRNTLQQCLSTGHTSGEGVNLPGMCNGHPRSRG